MVRAMSAADRLFSWRDPYDLQGSGDVFLQAVRENLNWHRSRCGTYRRILDDSGFLAGQLRREEDLWRIPVIPTLYLKRHHLRSVPREKVRRTAVSSGTGGVRSRVVYDFPSLLRGASMVKTVLSHHGVWSPVPCRYLVMGYEPHLQVETGTVQTAFGATFTAPAVSRTYAMKRVQGDGESGDLPLQPDGERYRWNPEEVERELLRYRAGAASPIPLRIVGFPSYIYFLAKELERRRVRLSPPAASCILMSGGWKTFWREEIGREEFLRLAEDVLGIGRQRIFEFYSSVEHNILYRRCREGHFHVPVYSRVIVRRPDTLEPAVDGEAGLLSFVTPMMTGMPLLSIMTDDLAVMGRPAPGDACPCGCSTPWFDLLGRAGARQIVTCAAGAAERLREAVGEIPEWRGQP